MKKPSLIRTLLPTAVRDRVVGEVSIETEVSAAEILSLSRRRPVAKARQLVAWRLRKIERNGVPAYGWSSIGRGIGRDHTTAIHAYNRIEAELAEKEGF